MAGTVSAFHIETVINEAGELRLDGLPFVAGQMVQVIVLPAGKGASDLNGESENIGLDIFGDHALKGTVLRYDDPFGPATPLEGWEVFQ